MSEVLTAIQQEIEYNYQQLAYYESLYNQAIIPTNVALSLLNACYYGQNSAWLGIYSCRNNQGDTEANLKAKYNELATISGGHYKEINKIKKEIERLNTELALYTDQVEDLTDLRVDISNSDQVIRLNEKSLSIQTFKKYAVPLIIFSLVFFGIYLVRRKGKSNAK